MRTISGRPRTREKLLMTYVKRNTRLILTLSLGALILVLVASSSGGFCYLSSKKSMTLAARESPVDVVFEQNYYEVKGAWKPMPHPKEFLQIIYEEADVVNAYGLAGILIDVNVTVDEQDMGLHKILILTVSKKEGFNITLSQGSFVEGANQMVASEGFLEEFNITLGDRVRLVKVTSRDPYKERYLEGQATGVTPKQFSQVIDELGLHESLLLAEHKEAKLLLFNQYPFVLVDMNYLMLRPFLDWVQKHYSLSILATFFVKFDHQIYLNPWDTDITVFNLNELGEDLRRKMNNYTATRTHQEIDAVSIKAVPQANIFQELSRFININRLTVIAFGATVAFVGWYFYSSVTQASLSTRVKELQLMRVRGVSRNSITRSISLMVIVSGIIGTTVGMLIGFALTTSIGPAILDISITGADVTQTFGISSLMVYAFFGLAASLISQRQALTEVRTILPTSEQLVTDAKPKMNLTEKLILIIALSLGSMKTVSWIFGFSLVGGGQTANPITSALLLLVRLIDQTVLDALGALLLVYALATIVSRRPRVLSSISYSISKALSPRLSLLSKKIMGVKSAKMVGMIVVASLLIFNTVSTNMGHSGVETAWKDLSATVVGADIRIDVPEETSSTIIQLLDNISGVDDYAQILVIAPRISSPLGSSVIYAVDPGRYSVILTKKEADLESLNEGEVFVSDYFQELDLLNIGDVVTLEERRELKVRGFVKNLPGLLSIPPIERFALISVKSLEDLNYTAIFRTFLVKVDNTDPEIVAEEFVNGLHQDIRMKVSVSTRSQIGAEFGGRMAAPLIVESVMSMLLIASVVGVIFAGLALGVMGYNAAINRRHLDALLRVKGVTRRQLLGLAFSEALCTLMMSLVIGVFAGYAMSSGYTFFFSAAFPITATPIVSCELVTQLLLLVAIYLIAFLTPALYAMKELRIRFL